MGYEGRVTHFTRYMGRVESYGHCTASDAGNKEELAGL